MPGLKEIKNRIKSVQSTRKITRAMQMVSAAKMKKAQNAALASRTYSSLAWELILNLSQGQNLSSPLFQVHPKSKKIGVLLLTTNGGFVGSLNTYLLNELDKIRKSYPDSEMEVIAFGRKGRDGVLRFRQKLIADFEKPERTLAASDVFPVAQAITDLYQTSEYKKIIVVYSHFITTVTQKPVVKQLLPFAKSLVKIHTTEELEDDRFKERGYNYEFEPTPKSVFKHLLPRIIESQIYQAMLESEASEHSARMIMMKNATDAAGDLIADYTLTYNQLRQNKITTELAEITAGKIALE